MHTINIVLEFAWTKDDLENSPLDQFWGGGGRFWYGPYRIRGRNANYTTETFVTKDFGYP
jgi:hypothetical protein